MRFDISIIFYFKLGPLSQHCIASVKIVLLLCSKTRNFENRLLYLPGVCFSSRNYLDYGEIIIVPFRKIYQDSRGLTYIHSDYNTIIQMFIMLVLTSWHWIPTHIYNTSIQTILCSIRLHFILTLNAWKQGSI